MLHMQVYAFLVVALAGAAAGALFDLLRVIRWRLQPGSALGATADLTYWGLATAVLGTALFLGNWGELRLYVLLGLGSGAASYFWLASPVMQGLFAFLLQILAWVTMAVAVVVRGVVIRPLAAAGAGVWRAGARLAAVLARPLRWAGVWGRRRWLRVQQVFITRVLSWLLPRDDDQPPPDQ